MRQRGGWLDGKVARIARGRFGTKGSSPAGRANGRRTRTYNLDFGCDVPKRYKFVVKNGGSSQTIYKPSANGFTSSRDLTVNINF